MKRLFTTRRMFLSTAATTAVSGLLPVPWRTLAAVVPGKSLQQLVEEMNAFGRHGRKRDRLFADQEEQSLIGAFRRIGLPAMPYLEVTMREGNPKARRVVVRVFGGMVPAAVPHLVAALNDANLEIQATAAFYLAAMPPTVPLNAQIMALLLDEQRPHLVKAAAGAWAGLRNTPRSAVPVLTKLLRDRKIPAEPDAWVSDTPDFSARIDVLRALGKARPPAIRAIYLAARADEPAVRMAAAEILAEIARGDSADGPPGGKPPSIHAERKPRWIVTQ